MVVNKPKKKTESSIYNNVYNYGNYNSKIIVFTGL